MCDKMAISAYILKIVEKDPFLRQNRQKNIFRYKPKNFFEILCAFVVTGVTTTKSTAVHKLESVYTKKLLEIVWSEQLVLDGKAFF